MLLTFGYLSLYSLFNLYNLLDHPYARFQVYMKALTLAVDGKVTEYITPSFKKIDNFLKEWNIDIEDQRELFLAIANVLKENKRYCNIILYVLILLIRHSLSGFPLSFLFRCDNSLMVFFFLSINFPAW